MSRRFWNEANSLIYQYQQFGLKFKDWKVDKTLRAGSLLWQQFPSANLPEYILEKELMKSWKAFYASLKSYQKNPSKFRGRPEPPGFLSYKINQGRRPITFRDRACSIKDGKLILSPQTLNWKFETRLPDGTDIRVVKLIPKPLDYLLLITYKKDMEIESQPDPHRVIGIDLGMVYLATLANNFGVKPLAIPGREFCDYLNKKGIEHDRIKSEYDRRGIKDGKRLKKLSQDVDRKKFQVFHTVSSAIVNWCAENRVSKIAIGYNEGWKQETKQNGQLNRSIRRKFSSIPYAALVSYIEYKAAEKGIEVKRINEAHTSKCSYFDNEPIEHHDKYSGKRNGRLFTRENGQKVHADLNGAYNIMRKAFPREDINLSGSGALSHPRKWPVARVYNGEGLPPETYHQDKEVATTLSS